MVFLFQRFIYISVDRKIYILDIYSYVKVGGGEELDGTNLKNVQPGTKVRIEQPQDRQTGRLTEGVVGEPLTRSEHHPHGIKVRLTDGSIGRVKEVVGPTSDLYNEEEGNKEFLGWQIEDIIKKGEGNQIEFKSTLRKDIRHGTNAKYIENAVLKTVVAFLNTSGGIVLVGVGDTGDIIGIGEDGFENNDKFYLHFSKIFDSRIGPEFIPLIDSSIINYKEESILKILCKESNKEVYLIDENQEKFYIRSGPKTIGLDGRKLVEYIKKRFND